MSNQANDGISDSGKDGLVKDSGTILLTQADLDELRSGAVSQRVKELWGLSLEELTKTVQENNYKVI